MNESVAQMAHGLLQVLELGMARIVLDLRFYFGWSSLRHECAFEEAASTRPHHDVAVLLPPFH